jgi:hypothetical protein
MSSITEIKQKTTIKVDFLKGNIDLIERMIKHIQKFQERLEVLVEEDVISDGDYLKLCNRNLEEMKKYQKDIYKIKKQLYKLTK